MGYESTMELTGEVKDTNGLNNAIRNLKLKTKPAFYYEFIEMMHIKSGDVTFIEFDEYYGKFYDTEGFIRFIAPFLEPQDIIFTGEDGTKWGYRIEKDCVRHLRFIVTAGDILFRFGD